MASDKKTFISKKNKGENVPIKTVIPNFVYKMTSPVQKGESLGWDHSIILILF